MFVDSAAHLSVQNVTFSNNAAVGGNGSNTSEAGGGGLGGNGGSGTFDISGGGGGGLYGNGGHVQSLVFSGSGGGGGELGNGGNGATGNNPSNEAGGGGGGQTANGSNGSGNTGGAGGGSQGGAGGNNNASGSNGATGGGGGGSGFSFGSAHGGAGGLFGGGGGGAQEGGNGGNFGGGGGSASTGGAGGFGGGGGNGDSQGGAGGFGGGGGGAFGGSGGTGGFGGGNGSSSGGGGGAAFGGAVFAADGATITVINSVNFSGNTVTAGSGAGSGGNGSANGNDLFLMKGTTTNFDIASGQTLTFTPPIGNNDGTTNAGVVIDKTGQGTLVLDGASAYSGATTVGGGTLVVDNNLAGTMTVDSGGTLMGTGTVGATTVQSGGTIYPGTVGAPLTVSGPFTQSTGSAYSAEVSPTASDEIIVNGHATIQSGATFNVVLDPGTYTAGHSYVVLDASGGVSGTYSILNLPSLGSGLAFSLEYMPDEVILLVGRSGTNFASAAQTSNQFQVGATLDATSGSASGDYSTVMTALEALSPGQLPGAMNQLAGDIYPSLSNILLENTTDSLQLINNRLVAQLSPASTVAPSSPMAMGASQGGAGYQEPGTMQADVQLVSFQQAAGRPVVQPRIVFRRAPGPAWTGWTQGYGLRGNINGNGNAGGTGYGLGGTLFGVDRWLDANTVVGGFGGYAGTSVGDQLVNSHATISSYQVGLYEMHRRDRLYLTNIDAYSNNTYQVTRDIQFGGISRTATGASSGNQWAHYTECGYTLGRGATRLQPLMGLQYIYLDQGGYTETGAGSLNLTTSSQYVNSVRGNFGGRVYREVNWRGVRTIPVASAVYQREWGTGTDVISSSFSGAPTTTFATAGNYLGRDFGLFTLGTNAYLSERASLYGSVNSQVSAYSTAVFGAGGFLYRW